MLIIERHRSAQRGATLLEILISILIFSIGLLGLASMQITSKRANYEALQRSTAAVLAHGILERREGGEIVLRDLAGNLTSIKESKVDTLIASPTSGMPEGLLAGMSDQDLRDFFAYLMK